MGFLDFFRGRRERESAISTEALPDASGLGGFGKVFEEALRSGGTQMSVSQGASQVMNLQGQAEDLRQAILETLRRNGIDAVKGQEVQVTDPDLQQQIFKTLAEHGVDVGAVAGAVAADPAVPMGGGGDTVSQLERLQRLREQGALTDNEFEEQKRRIIGG
jgi:hypothetical protein